MDFIVSIKSATDPSGPLLVSDDPAVVRAVLDAIHRRFAPVGDGPNEPDIRDFPCGPQPLERDAERAGTV